MVEFSQDDVLVGRVDLAGVQLDYNKFDTIRAIVKEEERLTKRIK